MGIQHVIAMFGATVLAPILMGFDPNVAILMSGIGTLIFFLGRRRKVPSYLGSSFAFIGVVIAATAYAGKGPNANLAVALGGIIACGAAIAVIGLIVQMIGGLDREVHATGRHGRRGRGDRFHLAGIPIKNMAPTPFDAWMQAVTFSVWARWRCVHDGLTQRLLISSGFHSCEHRTPSSPTAWVSAKRSTLRCGQRCVVRRAEFRVPTFDANAMLLIVPVAIILIAEKPGPR